VIQHDISHDPQQGGLLDLPSVVLGHVISYLTDPRDLLNFGQTHPLVCTDQSFEMYLNIDVLS